jgi:hypothetical protein
MSNVEVVHDGVIHFKIRHSLIDIRYLKSGILPRFMYSFLKAIVEMVNFSIFRHKIAKISQYFIR